MTRRRRGPVDWRVSLTVAIGVTVATLMLLLGMEPRLVLVAFVVAATAAVTWLAVDLGPLATPISWSDHRSDTSSAPRADHRVRTLRARLRQPAHRRRTPMVVGAGPDDRADEIADTLVTIIDDHLREEFGLDRATDPTAAATVLGTDLNRFVDDPSARRSMTGRRSLARTVSLIEDLCSRTHAA